jgi:3-oxoadipate enol-lactonase
LNTTDRLKEIRCPTLVIAGAEDPGTTVAMAREIYLELPGAELAVLPQASHLSNIEQAAMFNATVLAFLRFGVGA